MALQRESSLILKASSSRSFRSPRPGFTRTFSASVRLTCGFRTHITATDCIEFSSAIIAVEQWGEDLSREVTAWETKSDARLLWRGRNTGGYFSKETQWRNSHRARLTSMVSLNATDKVLVLPPPHNAAESQRSLKEAMKVQDRSRLNEVMFDIGLAYEPIRASSQTVEPRSIHHSSSP